MSHGGDPRPGLDPAIERHLARREFLAGSGLALGSIALSSLLRRDGLALGAAAQASSPHGVTATHFPAKAKRVIFLFMAGGPSQLELFEHKPKLTELDGEPIPDSLMEGKRFAFIGKGAKLLGGTRRFERRGRSGAWVSELLPHIGGVVDELCFLKGMHTDQINHGPAKLFMNTGSPQFGRPSMGSWVTYALGSETQDLPAFVVLRSGTRGPRIGSPLWGSGFLPTRYQGIPLLPGPEPILHLKNPPGIDAQRQRDFHRAVADLNAMRGEVDDGEIQTRIAAYEMAERMQESAPELIDLSGEPAALLEDYGAEPGVPSYAMNCLLARRMIERGVRFVQLYHADWDHHGNAKLNLLEPLDRVSREIDRPTAALIRDLKQRGLLEDTIVVWGGEFGRTPMTEYRVAVGRDHHIDAFTMFVAGGGFKAGHTHGATDELGLEVVDGALHVHDLHATILHLLGLDHLRLTYRFQGRDFRLTDVFGEVRPELFA